MIAWLENIVRTITSFFQSIGDLITSIIDKFKQFFAFIAAAFEFVTSAFALIPSYYVAFGVIIVSVLVLFLILGRNAGGD